MTHDPTAFPGPDPGPPAVGAFVSGSYVGAARTVVRACALYADYHELTGAADPESEAFLSVYTYPPGQYCEHFVKAGNSPRGYAGPASCPRLVFDIDRRGDLPAALADTRTLVRHLLARYPAKLEDGIGVYFSGSKGFHTTVELVPGFDPSPTVPVTCKRLALTIAAAAGVVIDTSCYDHQRLLRLPNTRHPATGLYKRFVGRDELFALNAGGIAALARHPAGFTVPSAGEFVQELQDDFDRAAAPVPRAATNTVTAHPTVPKYVRDFIGFGDVEDPGRAVTLFRCAAALAEAGTPDAVVAGLLEEPAVKTGLAPAEVRRQIASGIAHGRPGAGKGGAA